MARKSKEQLNKIKKQYGVDDLYSWSKYHTYKTDSYEYYLKYIKKIKEDRSDGIYAISGGTSHEIIEDFYLKNITNKEMLERYEEKLFDFNLAELKYDRTDEEKNEKIANKYETCMRHFFLNHRRVSHNIQIEKFITINIDGNIFQGYIDSIWAENINGENHIYINDWKTSSLYTGKKIQKECGQLLLYAEGIRQKLNIPLSRIHIMWCFLKYVEVVYTQAKGDKKNRIIDRHEIASKLKSNAGMWLKKLKYDELEIEKYLDEMTATNSIECLPEDVKEKFEIKDCYVEILIDEDIVNELKEDIIKTVAEIKQKETEYKKNKDEKIFWQEVTDYDSYRLANLSGYSRKIHKPYDEYLKNLEMFKTNNEEEKEDDWMKELGL